MGKGKIIITSEAPEEPNSNENEPTNKDKSKNKKIRNKNKKLKNQMRKEKGYGDRVAALERIADQEDERYERGNEDEEVQVQEEEGYERKEGVKTMLNEKCRLKHLAICFPDSILQIPQTSALRSYFISQVARISSIFKVDQLIILKDHGYNAKSQNFTPSSYIARNLQYLETPQYLRKHLFKMHPDLKNAGIMNPIECHHHLKVDDVCEFRDGVAVDRPTKAGFGSWVDIGLGKQARMDCMVLPGTRVTLRLKDYEDNTASFFEGQAVSKKVPREEQNLYWGYDVRIANSFKQMLSSQYDIKIICNHHERIPNLEALTDFNKLDLQDKSILIFFSGTDNLNTLIERDEGALLTTEQVLGKFDYSFVFQGFGVMKLRMEEQLFMALSRLSRFVV